MNIILTDVDQRYSLHDKSFSNLLTLALPSGARFQVVVDDEVVAAVLKEAQGQPSEYQPTLRQPAPPPSPVLYAVPAVPQELEVNPFEDEDGSPETPVDLPEQLDHHVDSGVVEWETLPDTQLPPSIKRVMRLSKINPIISISDLDQLKLEIGKKLAERPKAGKVDWDSGPRRRVEAVPRRQVQMDEAGNPLPPGGIIELRSEDDKDSGEMRDEEEDAQQA
jgi:hypothetical protein